MWTDHRGTGSIPIASDSSIARVPGPWKHRDISANGVRLHVAELGEGPLVLLLHGFPEFWWAWSEQLTAVAAAGYRAVAVDLRGYGDSDKPPRGYDGWTLAGDATGLIRALGERDAHLIGHAWGGLICWAAAALHPRLVRSISVLSAPHPLALRQEIRRGLIRRQNSQTWAASLVFRAQLPISPERFLCADRAASVERLIREWSGPTWLAQDVSREVIARDRAAMLIPGVAHSACEYFRWAIRSQIRSDGRRFAKDMSQPLSVPVLQIHGALDPYLLESTARASRRWLGPQAVYQSLPRVGHFPHHEAPIAVNELVTTFLNDVDQH